MAKYTALILNNTSQPIHLSYTMSDTSFPYNETTNLGFITNPNIQDATLKANDRREQWLLDAYHYANSDRDEASRKASSAIFGDGTIPLSDKENSAYFLGDAILREHGYTGSPLQYFYANKLDLPPDVTDEATARIHIGNKLINEMRATYDERKKIEQDFAAIQNDLPIYLAEAVRTPGGSTSELPNKEIASILNKAGAWTKMRPSIERARLAWLKTWSFFRNIDTMQSLTRGDLLELANELSDENGKLDELAMLAFSTALQQYATELQSTDINFFENWADSLQNVNTEKQDSKLRESKEGTLERLELLARTVETAKENGLSTEEATSMYEREVAALKDDRVNRLRGLMNAAMNIAMEPSEQASTLAKVLSSGGTLAGGMILPMAGSIAAGMLAKGKGGGFFSQAAAGYAGGFAASQDFIVNQAVMQAYFESKENPETYGRLSGTGQAAAENVFGTGTSAFFLFKGVSKLATKAAAKSVTNKAFSNAIARGTLAYFGTTAIEGTGELMEEELGAYLGSKLNQLARATGTKVSEQEYTAWKTISEMPAHQVAAIYGMAAVLGIGGGIANYQKAQAWSMNVDNLRQSGFSDKAARDIVADGILHAEKVEEVKNSDRTEEEKQLLLTNLQDERLEYLGKQFNKDILNASPEELNTRSKEENEALIYKMLLAQSIKNGLDEQTLVNLGFTTSERQPNGNYLLTYLEPAEGENAQPKLVQKEWNRDQLTGFLTFQQDTAIHKQLRELQSQIVAQQFAHSVESTSELAIRLANLRDTPLTELATIRKHMAITIDLFREFARKEAANIAADVSAGMPLTQAEQQPSTILPNVARGSVLQLVEKAEARIENAIQTGEIKPGQPVHFPGINISALDGSGLVAFFSGKINLAQMLEEMFEIRLKQLRSTEDIQGMAGTLKAIQSKLPGVKLLPGNKTTYTKDDIVEAYSHLAVAEVITNPAYYSHLTQAEQALINDVLANVNRAHKYKIIADAWQNFKNSEEGKAYLQQSGKDLMDIMQEAGFTFGKHFTTVQATEEQKTKLLAEHNFIPDFSAQTNRLLENAQAQQELEKQNQQEAAEPTTIPASESVTGEEIVVTPEEKEAVEEPVEISVAEPTLQQRTENAIRERLESGKKGKKKTSGLKLLSEATKRVRSGKGTTKDYAVFFRSNLNLTEAQAIEQGVRLHNQSGAVLPAYKLGHLIAERFTEEEYQAYINDVLSDKEVRNLIKTRTDQGIIEEANKLTPKTLPKSAKWPSRSTKSGTAQQQRDTIVKTLSSLVSTDEVHRVLHNVHHTIQGGVETFAATDGRRAALISKPAASKTANITENYSKNGQTVEVFLPYPNISKVLEKANTPSGTLNLAPYRYLESLTQKKRKVELPHSSSIRSSKYITETYIPAEKWQVEGDGRSLLWQHGNKLYKYDALYIRDAIKLFSQLGKTHGFPPSVSVSLSADGQMLWHAEHDGWTADHIIMPVYMSDRLGNVIATTLKKGDVLLNPASEQTASSDINFSIAPMDDLGLRFAGEPIAVRMMNYIRDEGKRYSRNLGNKTSHDTAVNAIAHAQSIIGALDKYINTTKKPIRAADRARLGLLQRLIEKYAQIIKKGSTRSFAKIDPHEQEELIAAIQEAGAGIDWEAIEAIPTEEYNRIQQEVQNDLLPELYRKHATAFANKLSAESYSTPADIRERMQALQQAAQTGHPNKNITPQDLTNSGYNSQPTADLKRDVLKQYAEKELKQLQQSEEQNRKEFENAKTRTLQALQRIIKEGRLAENSTLGQAEQQQLTDAVEQEAQTQTEKETRKRVLDTYREQIKRDAEERYKQLVRTAAKGRVYTLLTEMMQDAGDILDNYLKADLLQKMKRITKSVAIKRTASKKLKGKLTAAGYRELQQAILLMDMSARAKDDVQDDIDISTIWLTTYAGKDIDTLRKGTDLLKELADLIESEGGTVTEANLNIALNNYRNAVLVFADLDSKNYMQTLQAANALALLINHHKSTWAALQERRTSEMKAYLDYFLANTPETSGTDNAIRKAAEKAKTIITFLPDSMMNTAQLFAALASYPALKPIFDDMRYNLANAQTAREVHLRNIRQQELAAFGRIIGMQPFNEAGYSEKQLQEISDKFDTFFMENNQVKPTDISITLFKDGKEHTYKWEGTKWEALGLILTYRQQHYQTNAQIHGYTPAVLEALQNHIGEKLMSFGNAIQQIIVNDGTIAVYEEREGVPMQENPLYFPASININTINTTREEPLTSPYHPTAMHDFLHVRVKHTDEAKAKNAYLTYRSAIADRANYIYLDPITTNIDRLLAHREFTNRLASLIGPNLHKQLIKTIKEIKGAGYQETSLQDMTDSRLSQALSSSVLTLLPFNLGSYARQFSAVANAGLMPDISPVALVQYALKIRNDQGHISIPGILKLDAFSTRRRDNAFVNEVASMENNVKFSHLLKWTKTGLNWMDKLDVLANAFSAAIVYNHKYDQLKTMGELSEEDITKLCEQEVNAYVRLLAQPLNRVDKSALYWSLSGSALTRCLLFMGSESINKVGMLRSNYISAINNGRGHIMASLITIAKMGVTVGIGNFVIESMLALLSGNAPDDKDDSLAAWLAAQYLNAAIGQYLDIMPVFGQFTRKLFNPYEKVGFKDLNIPGSNFDTYGGKLYKMLTDDKEYSGAEWQRQTTNFLREFTSILGYAGGAYSKWQIYSHITAMLHNITAALNAGNIIARHVENEGILSDILPDFYTKTNRRKRKRHKSAIERMLTPDSDTDSSDTPTPLNISPELLKDYPDLAPYLQPKS